MAEIGKSYLDLFGKKPEPKPVEPVEVTPVAEEPTPEPLPVEPVIATEPTIEPEPTPPTEPIVEPIPTTEPELTNVEVTTPVEQQPDPTSTPPTELSDEAVLRYLQEKSGKELESIDGLFKEPEPVVDPLADLPEETQQFIKYNKETGRSYDEFKKLNTDYTKFTPLQLAQQKAIEFSDGALSLNDVNEFLEKELGIDLDNPSDLEKFDAIKLKAYGKDFLQRQIADQDKYKQPIEKQAPIAGPEMVTLENGTQMTKDAFDNQVNQREQYLEAIKSSSDNITNTAFQVKIDDNGNEKLINLSYDYSKDDKHEMVSNAADLTNMVTKLFSTKDGGIDYEALQEGLWRANPVNMGKIVKSLIHKARAEWTEEMTKDNLNANFDTSKRMPSNQNVAQTVPLPGAQQAFGVKYSLEQFKK